jgi:hypothetical protein
MDHRAQVSPTRVYRKVSSQIQVNRGQTQIAIAAGDSQSSFQAGTADQRHASTFEQTQGNEGCRRTISEGKHFTKTN